jgi:hypothetical protein
MVILAPIVKVTDKTTYGVFKTVSLPLIVVRLQDLVSKTTYKFNKTYYDIVSQGGLHNYLEFNGEIMLSLIMKDKILSQFNSGRYAEVINSLSPDSSTTVDGETYEGEYLCSLGELKRIQKENEQLLKLCPKCAFYGLVKGCSPNQIEKHILQLKALGVDDLIFHIGDYFRNGDPSLIMRARNYAIIIRRHARRLILYGMGSQRRMLQFSFADVYVTFNHFVTAKNGMRYAGTKKVKYIGSYRPEIVISNFLQMLRNMKLLEEQTKLI